MTIVSVPRLTDISLWNSFFVSSVGLRDHQLIGKFVIRVLQKYPENIPARILTGHFHMMNRSYKVALAEYLPAYIRLPSNPTMLMSLGLAYLNQALSRTNPDRNMTVMQAFTFLFRYGDVNGWTQEALYNVGRAFHQLDLLNFATHMYQKALEASPILEKAFKAARTGGTPAEIDLEAMEVDDVAQADFERETDALKRTDLSMEIAYNLSLIYRRSGSHMLANSILSKHIVI